MIIDGFTKDEYFYERSEMKYVFSHLKSPRTIVDVGANIGIWSIYLAKNYPNSEVMTFEPVNSSFFYLGKNLARNNITNVVANSNALGEKEKYTNLYYYQETPGASSIKKTQNSNYIKEKTMVHRLDDYGFKDVDFIKIDTEGAELNVLKGGINTIKKYKPMILCEMMRKYTKLFGYHPDDIINFLAPLGYKCYYLYDNKLVQITRMSDKLLASNFFFLC